MNIVLGLVQKKVHLQSLVLIVVDEVRFKLQDPQVLHVLLLCNIVLNVEVVEKLSKNLAQNAKARV